MGKRLFGLKIPIEDRGRDILNHDIGSELDLRIFLELDG